MDPRNALAGNTRCTLLAAMLARSCVLRVGVATCLFAVALHEGAAQGDPAPTPDVTGAPVPGAESGQTWNEESEPQPSGARVVARGMLWIPKALAWLALQPVRGGVWVYDRYDLRNRYYRLFYNDTRTFGIVPSVEYATGFSLMFGGRLIATDTFGGHEHLTLGGAYGGTYQMRAKASLDSGERLGPVSLSVGGNFDRFARLAFYGIGNADRSDPPAMLIDPLTDDTAVRTHFRYQEVRAALQADWRVLDDLHLVGHGAAADMTFDGSTRDPSIDAVYNSMDLVGFEQGVTHLYGQLELRWDRRRIARPPWETQYATGWLASGFVGGVHGFAGAHDFAHYGVDLQAFIHLALGPRRLWFRLWAEGVTAHLDEVPFVELPYLGGDLLRGYDFARFRDRVSALGTAQYSWDASRYVDAFLFVDAGRVYRALDDLTLDDLRVGYGGGVAIHSAEDFVISTTLASSRDGGVFLTAALNPVWSEVPRWR